VIIAGIAGGVGLPGAASPTGIRSITGSTGLAMAFPAPPSDAAAAAAGAEVVPSATTPGAPSAASAADIAADARLVAECRQGVPGALERLVERFQTDVFGTALRLTRDRDVALELTNSIFFKVYQNLEAFQPGRPLRPWLLRIATNEALNWLRSRRREREHVLGSEASDVAFEQLPGGADPEDAALTTERRETVRAALARLPEHYRLVLTLRFFNDLSYQEIAEQTGQDANTVGVQLLRARQLLKRELLAEETRK
jgi:RNA polymerase sigma-70 factor (ECF subfamily)